MRLSDRSSRATSLRAVRALVLWLLIAFAAAAPAAAQREERDRALAKILEESYAARPDPSFQFLLAETYARLGEKERAVKALRIVVRSGKEFFPPKYNPVWKYADDPEVAKLLAQLRARLPVTTNGVVQHALSGRTLATEGIAFDPKTNRLFLGDLTDNSILQISPDGCVRPFVTGLPLQPYGMAVDAERRRLWVATSDFLAAKGKPQSSILQIGLDSGEVKRFTHPDAVTVNDVAVAPNGDVFVSDFTANIIWKIANGSTEMTDLLERGSVSFPNGLAVDDEGRLLFVAQGSRPAVVDLASAKLRILEKPATLDMLGTDGLYFRSGALYAIQNLTTPGRVIRMELNPERTGISSFRVMESANPLFDLPTTGAMVGDKFVIIANAQLYHIDGQAAQPDQFDPVVLLAYDLRDGANPGSH